MGRVEETEGVHEVKVYIIMNMYSLNPGVF